MSETIEKILADDMDHNKEFRDWLITEEGETAYWTPRKGCGFQAAFEAGQASTAALTPTIARFALAAHAVVNDETSDLSKKIKMNNADFDLTPADLAAVEAALGAEGGQQ